MFWFCTQDNSLISGGHFLDIEETEVSSTGKLSYRSGNNYLEATS